MSVAQVSHVFNRNYVYTAPHARLNLAKEALLAGFPLIAAMRSHNIEHRDFTFRNVYFQVRCMCVRSC